MELEGAVAVVTGAASGIGRATAIGLARAGCDVVLADINADGLSSVAKEIDASGRRALPITANLSRRIDVEGVVEQALAWQGRIDLFVANVGVGCEGQPHEFTVQEWEYLLGVNLWSAIWPLRLVMPHMLERGSGHLVFLSSGSGFEGSAERAPYNVAKFALVGLAESVARATKDTGVNVTLVVPGAVASDGWKSCVVADAQRKGEEEVERVRAELRDHMAGWPKPEVMADAIVEGISNDRYCVIQDNPYEPDWFANTLRRKGEDPQGFVLGNR